MSRSHAFIRENNGEYYLEDRNSKFGTLVQINESLQLAPYVPYCVQVGRTVLTILARNPNRLPYNLLYPGAKSPTIKLEVDNPEKQATEINGEQEGLIDYALNEAHPTTFPVNNISNQNYIYQ